MAMWLPRLDFITCFRGQVGWFLFFEILEKGAEGTVKTKNQGSQHSENGSCNSPRLEASNLHVSLLIHSTEELGVPK